MILATKIRRGLYRLHHKCSCGGDLRAELVAAAKPWLRWEVMCESCLECDPNGYATLRECIEAAPGFWKSEAKAKDGENAAK